MIMGRRRTAPTSSSSGRLWRGAVGLGPQRRNRGDLGTSRRACRTVCSCRTTPVRHQGRATRNLLPKLEADLKALTKAYNTKRKIGLADREGWLMR
jgi:hypothetical protein